MVDLKVIFKDQMHAIEKEKNHKNMNMEFFSKQQRIVNLKKFLLMHLKCFRTVIVLE